MKPDLAMAGRFLGLLDAKGIFTFQTFDDHRKRKSGALVRVRHGTLDEHAPELVRLNAQGAGVFVMINCGDGVRHPGERTCRAGKSVRAIRSLFVDLDGAPLEPVLTALHPDVVVESSPGRWHGYWRTNDCPLEAFKPAQAQIAAKFNGDPSVKDLPRVMRLPGFYHQKDDPFITRIVFPE